MNTNGGSILYAVEGLAWCSNIGMKVGSATHVKFTVLPSMVKITVLPFRVKIQGLALIG